MGMPWWEIFVFECRVILCRDYVAVVLKGSIEKTVGRTLFRVEKSVCHGNSRRTDKLNAAGATDVVTIIAP